MTDKLRITWRVEHDDADRRSRALVEAIDPRAEPEPIIACDEGEDLPDSIRGLRHAYVERAVVEQLCEVLVHERGVIEVERSLPWKQANAGICEPAVDELPVWPDGGSTPDLRGRQRYLSDSPEGVSAFAGWRTPGTRGAGTLVVDLEYGWRLDHEQLVECDVDRLSDRGQIDDHGTAVLGILGAANNGRGVVGLVPEARLAIGVGDPDGNGRWNPEAAIHHAAQRILRNPGGGVIVLEMQASEHGNLPVECLPATFLVVRFAITRGVHVVVAAGNGGKSIDERLRRGSRDSGSIIVGAGGSGRGCAAARTRLDFSNFGERVDLQAWGQHVATCGGPSENYYDLWSPPDEPRSPTRCYTGRFDGTSAAAPIVAGCVAAILGACRAAGRAAPGPAAMRALLRETGTPQPSNDLSRGQIGPLPNLRAALDELALS